MSTMPPVMPSRLTATPPAPPGPPIPCTSKVGSQTYWYQNDHLGTPQKLIDTSGRVVWAATYDAFGQAQISLSEIENNLRFPGQYWDAETGLHYNWNRYYDSATGRYLSTDPAHEGLNLYGYVFGNPNSLIDPQGLCALRIVGGALEVFGGVPMLPGCFVGTAAGIALIANGLDNLIAGTSSLLAGEYKDGGP